MAAASGVFSWKTIAALSVLGQKGINRRRRGPRGAQSAGRVPPQGGSRAAADSRPCSVGDLSVALWTSSSFRSKNNSRKVLSNSEEFF